MTDLHGRAWSIARLGAGGGGGGGGGGGTGTGAGGTQSGGTTIAPAHINAPGLVARLAPIKGVTPARVLAHRIYLPAVLNSLTLTEQATHTDYETLSAGQFSQPAMGPPSAGQLRTLPLDALTLAWDAEWLTVTKQNPAQLRSTLFAILRARKAVHLLVLFHPHPGGWPEIDMNVTLRSVSRELRPQEIDTRYLTFAIEEWRDARVGRRSSARPASRAGRKPGVTLPATHVLKASDTLHSLSHEYYGTYAWWKLIRDANGIPKKFGATTPIVSLRGHFKVGAKVKIPAQPVAHPVGPQGGA